MENDIEMDHYKTINQKKKLFPIYHTIHEPYLISETESRIINELKQFKKKRLTTGKYDIELSPYFKKENENCFIMFVEFKGIFKIQIIFLEEYPFIPPIITYISGKYFHFLFDYQKKLKLSCLNIQKWSSYLDLNSILFLLELKLNENILEVSKDFYKKRMFSEYKTLFNESSNNNIFSNEDNLKRLSDYILI
jgi:ubiquitin-protein ligase